MANKKDFIKNIIAKLHQTASVDELEAAKQKLRDLALQMFAGAAASFDFRSIDSEEKLQKKIGSMKNQVKKLGYFDDLKPTLEKHAPAESFIESVYGDILDGLFREHLESLGIIIEDKTKAKETMGKVTEETSKEFVFKLTPEEVKAMPESQKKTQIDSLIAKQKGTVSPAFKKTIEHNLELLLKSSKNIFKHAAGPGHRDIYDYSNQPDDDIELDDQGFEGGDPADMPTSLESNTDKANLIEQINDLEALRSKRPLKNEEAKELKQLRKDLRGGAPEKFMANEAGVSEEDEPKEAAKKLRRNPGNDRTTIDNNRKIADFLDFDQTVAYYQNYDALSTIERGVSPENRKTDAQIRDDAAAMTSATALELSQYARIYLETLTRQQASGGGYSALIGPIETALDLMLPADYSYAGDDPEQLHLTREELHENEKFKGAELPPGTDVTRNEMVKPKEYDPKEVIDERDADRLKQLKIDLANIRAPYLPGQSPTDEEKAEIQKLESAIKALTDRMLGPKTFVDQYCKMLKYASTLHNLESYIASLVPTMKEECEIRANRALRSETDKYTKTLNEDLNKHYQPAATKKQVGKRAPLHIFDTPEEAKRARELTPSTKPEDAFQGHLTAIKKAVEGYRDIWLKEVEGKILQDTVALAGIQTSDQAEDDSAYLASAEEEIRKQFTVLWDQCVEERMYHMSNEGRSLQHTKEREEVQGLGGNVIHTWKTFYREWEQSDSGKQALAEAEKRGVDRFTTDIAEVGSMLNSFNRTKLYNEYPVSAKIMDDEANPAADLEAKRFISSEFVNILTEQGIGENEIAELTEKMREEIQKTLFARAEKAYLKSRDRHEQSMGASPYDAAREIVPGEVPERDAVKRPAKVKKTIKGLQDLLEANAYRQISLQLREVITDYCEKNKNAIEAGEITRHDLLSACRPLVQDYVDQEAVVSAAFAQANSDDKVMDFYEYIVSYASIVYHNLQGAVNSAFESIFGSGIRAKDAVPVPAVIRTKEKQGPVPPDSEAAIEPGLDPVLQYVIDKLMKYKNTYITMHSQLSKARDAYIEDTKEYAATHDAEVFRRLKVSKSTYEDVLQDYKRKTADLAPLFGATTQTLEAVMKEADMPDLLTVLSVGELPGDEPMEDVAMVSAAAEYTAALEAGASAEELEAEYVKYEAARSAFLEAFKDHPITVDIANKHSQRILNLKPTHRQAQASALRDILRRKFGV